jgi:hypothetical protein
MKIAKVPDALAPALTPLVKDAKVLSAIVDVHTPPPKTNGVQLRIQSTSAAIAAATATVANYRELKVLAQDFLAPTITQLFPHSKLVINGVLAVSASVEAWNVMRSADADNEEKTIAVTRASVRVVSTLLSCFSHEVQPNFGEVVADAAIATAATLQNQKKLSGAKVVTKSPPAPAPKLTPLQGNLMGGYVIGTNHGLFAFQGKDLLALSTKLGDLPQAAPKVHGTP